MIKHRSFQCWGVGQHVNLSDVYQQRGNVVNFWNFNMTGLRHQKLKDVTSELSQFSPFISRLMDIQNPTPIGIKRCPTVSDHSVVLVVQSLSCIQRCDPVDCGPPGSSVHGIFQARMLEWVVISSSEGSSQLRNRTHVSCTGRLNLYHWASWEADSQSYMYIKSLFAPRDAVFL